jgi:hypothetical protein
MTKLHAVPSPLMSFASEFMLSRDTDNFKVCQQVAVKPHICQQLRYVYRQLNYVSKMLKASNMSTTQICQQVALKGLKYLNKCNMLAG